MIDEVSDLRKLRAGSAADAQSSQGDEFAQHRDLARVGASIGRDRRSRRSARSHSDGPRAGLCAGADLKEVLAGAKLEPGEPDFLDRASVVFDLLRNFAKPVIAALNGVTMAGGLELAMCADVIVAAESAVIGDAHANYGVYPGAWGAAILPRLIPLNMAMYLLLTGKTLAAAEMKALGLVCEVHPDDALEGAVMALAQQIAAKSPIALARMKEVARASADKSRADALLHEQVLLRRHLRAADLQEGLRAFSEKRSPCFQGR